MISAPTKSDSATAAILRSNSSLKTSGPLSMAPRNSPASQRIRVGAVSKTARRTKREHTSARFAWQRRASRLARRRFREADRRRSRERYPRGGLALRRPGDLEPPCFGHYDPKASGQLPFTRGADDDGRGLCREST